MVSVKRTNQILMKIINSEAIGMTIILYSHQTWDVFIVLHWGHVSVTGIHFHKSQCIFINALQTENVRATPKEYYSLNPFPL
jgi:hypothetical protein